MRQNPGFFRSLHLRFVGVFDPIRSVSLLLARCVLAYGFFEAAMKKLSNLPAIERWFASMGYPVPQITAPFVAYTEMVGVVLLLAGLGVRYISLPLMVIMVVAIITVHDGNGFKAINNGIEIPLYYFTILTVLLMHGAGAISLDWLIDLKYK